MYQLIIAEKPSVAQSIAAVLGAKRRETGYLEGGGYLVSWCFGHLAELASAETYNEAYAKWRYDDLPIVPFSWRWKISRDKWTQFEILKTLLHREDVGSVINACDAGREGELIFRTVYCMAGCTKPMQRLWISSMEDDAIRSGFQNLRPGSDYDSLHQSALCRAKADWLVGINATRLFSVLYHRTLNVGRVLSPTLALLVQREAEIGAFRAEPFYTVQLDCGGVSAVSEKFKDKAAAMQLADACAGQTAVVKCVKQKDRTEKPPALYDLTTLQRDANRILGYTAQQTLDYLQALYEKKLCTIRKTSSDLISGVEQQFKEICKERGISLEPEKPAQEQNTEKLYMVDNEKYIHVQRSDTGIDYTIYDAASAKALDGGVLDDAGQLLSAAALTVCKLHNIGDAAPIRLAPLELLNGLQEANELLLGAGEQITGVEATSTADSLPDLPQLEQGYPMPDLTVDFAQMYQFGYTDGNTMLPLSKERARELFLQDVPIFVLNSDNTEYMVLDTSDLDAHSGIFGVERTEWERVHDTLQPRRDIVAPKQPDALSYLHDDTAKTQPENYLKNAEMALEDDYGMIDGIISNGPKQTVAEQEERSSILAKLKAPVETTNRTEKHAPKRSAEKEL